jgi:uncharacterized membrane protein YpjA
VSVREFGRRLTADEGLPERPDLPAYLAPLPRWLENLGLHLAWPIVAVNLVGTAFGFYYYLPQFSATAPVAWPLVPDSPVATLFVALSLASWKLGYADRLGPLHALAFFGCLKLGAWTPFVLLAFADGFSYLPAPMYNFLFWSHLGMVLEAFLVYRYADFRPPAVAVAVGWYGLNDLVDYLVPVAGNRHHTLVPGQTIDPATNTITHTGGHWTAAAGAVALTALAVVLAVGTWRAKRDRGR